MRLRPDKLNTGSQSSDSRNKQVKSPGYHWQVFSEHSAVTLHASPEQTQEEGWSSACHTAAISNSSGGFGPPVQPRTETLSLFTREWSDAMWGSLLMQQSLCGCIVILYFLSELYWFDLCPLLLCFSFYFSVWLSIYLICLSGQRVYKSMMIIAYKYIPAPSERLHFVITE